MKSDMSITKERATRARIRGIQKGARSRAIQRSTPRRSLLPPLKCLSTPEFLPSPEKQRG